MNKDISETRTPQAKGERRVKFCTEHTLSSIFTDGRIGLKRYI